MRSSDALLLSLKEAEFAVAIRQKLCRILARKTGNPDPESVSWDLAAECVRLRPLYNPEKNKSFLAWLGLRLRSHLDVHRLARLPVQVPPSSWRLAWRTTGKNLVSVEELDEYRVPRITSAADTWVREKQVAAAAELLDRIADPELLRGLGSEAAVADALVLAGGGELPRKRLAAALRVLRRGAVKLGAQQVADPDL